MTQVKFWKFHVSDVILWNLTFIFSGSYQKFSLVLLQLTNYIFSPWKMRYYVIILVQRFCPLKIEITQFSDGFRLKVLHASLER